MVSITQSRNRRCKNTLGGIKSAYLAPYFKIPRSEVEYDGVTITEFPETVFYEFELTGGNTYEQTQTENDGGKFFDIGLTLTFNKLSIFDNINLQKLLKKDYFIVVEDNNGNFFLLGFRNGLTADSLISGTNPSQYTLDWSGQEEEIAPIVTGIMGTGIIIFDGIDYIFQNDDNYYFQDGNNYIF